MKKYFLLIIVTLVLVFMVLPAFAGDKLKIANSGDYPPYYSVNAQGKLEGFDVDISYALCKVMKKECELVVVDWSDIINQLVAGKYDAIVASMAKTSEREKLIDFTDCYSRSTASFVGKINAGLAISPEKLKGKVFGAVKDSYQQEYLEKKYKNIAVVKPYENIEKAFDALVKGEVDLLLEDSLIIYHFSKSKMGKEIDIIGDPLPADNPSSSAYVAVRKGEEKLKKSFNEAIQTIRLDGTFNKINKKYFPYSTY